MALKHTPSVRRNCQGRDQTQVSGCGIGAGLNKALIQATRPAVAGVKACRPWTARQRKMCTSNRVPRHGSKCIQQAHAHPQEWMRFYPFNNHSRLEPKALQLSGSQPAINCDLLTEPQLPNNSTDATRDIGCAQQSRATPAHVWHSHYGQHHM